MNRKITILTAALLVLASIAGPGVGAVQAQSEDSTFFDGLVSDDGHEGYLTSTGVWIADAMSGASRYYAAYFGEDSAANASAYASDFASTFNANSKTITDYANQRLDAGTDYDVFTVYFHDRDGGNVTRYVVTDIKNGEWTNARVLTPTEFKDLNRTSDHWVSLDWYQSRNADDELQTFVEEYAEPNKNLSTTYRAKLLAEYGAPKSDMWNATEES